MMREGEARRSAPPVVAVVVLALAAATVCGWLGVWQWDRAHARASTVRDDEPVPIAETLAPSTDAAEAIGRSVTVTGRWGDDAALVRGREVDGVPSVLLVRSLIVPADQTGTGVEARIAVLVGHQPEGEVVCADAVEGTVTASGYLRSSEPPPLADQAAEAEHGCGASYMSVLSVAELAQTWPGPLYSAVLVLDGGADGGAAEWAPMPERDPVTRLNMQSLLYAAEWWVFGLFALVVAFRWVRENGRDRTGEPEGAEHG
jgi:cytochrome oxidase assembly protein ShyY1